MVYGFQSGILLSYVWNVISAGKKKELFIYIIIYIGGAKRVT